MTARTAIRAVKHAAETPKTFETSLANLRLGHEIDGANVNARTSTRETKVEDLAASILHQGLIVPLTVRATTEPHVFQVVAGNRRLCALRLLQERGQLVEALRGAETIPVYLANPSASDAAAFEQSLTENVERLALEPVEEAEAFAALADAGTAIAEIALRFSVPEKRVRQRLAIGRLAPEIRAALQAGKIDLTVARAFTLASDPAVQTAVFHELGDAGHRSAWQVKSLLTRATCEINSREMRFVGLDAYKAAGGEVIQDLFDDRVGGGYAINAALVNQLVQKKLEALRESVGAEGWSWVLIDGEEGTENQWEFRRFDPPRKTAPAMTDADRERLSEIRAEIDGMPFGFDADSVDEETWTWQDEEGDEPLTEDDKTLYLRYQALREEAAIRERYATPVITADDYPAEVKARAGAIVGIDYEGEPSVLRGLLDRSKDHTLERHVSDVESVIAGPPAKSPAPEKKPADPALGQDVSQKLYEELMVDLTGGLQHAIASDQTKAEVLLVATLISQLGAGTSYASSYGIADQRSPLFVDAKVKCADPLERKPHGAFADQRLRFQKRLQSVRGKKAFPALLTEVAALGSAERRDLLAYCVALSLSVESDFQFGRSDDARAVARAVADYVAPDLSGAVKIDGASYWTRVPGKQILAAIREVAGAAEAAKHEKAKKADLVAVAERLVTPTGWLPPALRTPSYKAPAVKEPKPAKAKKPAKKR